MPRRLGLAPLLLLGPFVAPAAAERPQFLTETSLRLTAVRYAPAEVDIHWGGWIGAGVGLARFRGTTAYLDGDVETVLGNERRSFEANQSNYHLQLGLRRNLSWGEASAYLHHVSRHAVDRSKELPLDWNVLTVAARGPVDLPGRVPSYWSASLGTMTQSSNVGYRWEARASTRHDVVRRGGSTGYAATELRVMKTARSERLPRTGFFDAKIEGGLRLVRERRTLEVFLAVERRNDVLLLVPGARRRAVLGVRLGLSAGTAPNDPSAPPSSSPWCSWR